LTGTLVNTGAIIAGGLIGISAGRYLPEKIKTIMVQALGLSVVLVGLKMALSVTDLIVTIGCMLVGAITGELIRIEYWIERLGGWIKIRFRSNSSTFAEGFMSASVLYLTGAMMIVGSIQDGTIGDSTTLYVKSLIDGVIAIPLASYSHRWIAYRRDRHEPFENNKNTYRKFSARNFLCHRVGCVCLRGKSYGDRFNRSAEFRQDDDF